MFKTKKEIYQWLEYNNIKTYATVSKNLVVNVNDSVSLHYDRDIGKLPVQFGKVNGDFIVQACGLKTLKGSPHTIEGNFAFNDNSVTTLEYFPRYIGGNVYCVDNRLPTFHNIHKHSRFIGGRLLGGAQYGGEFEISGRQIATHILGVLLIKGIKGVAITGGVNEIVNYHLEHGRDVFKCQEDLIEAEFADFAKL